LKNEYSVHSVSAQWTIWQAIDETGKIAPWHSSLHRHPGALPKQARGARLTHEALYSSAFLCASPAGGGLS